MRFQATNWCLADLWLIWISRHAAHCLPWAGDGVITRCTHRCPRLYFCLNISVYISHWHMYVSLLYILVTYVIIYFKAIKLCGVTPRLLINVVTYILKQASTYWPTWLSWQHSRFPTSRPGFDPCCGHLDLFALVLLFCSVSFTRSCSSKLVVGGWRRSKESGFDFCGWRVT